MLSPRSAQRISRSAARCLHVTTGSDTFPTRKHEALQRRAMVRQRVSCCAKLDRTVVMCESQRRRTKTRRYSPPPKYPGAEAVSNQVVDIHEKSAEFSVVHRAVGSFVEID